MADTQGTDYHVAQEDFRKIIQHLQPWILSNFVMWLDIKVAEFKVIGHMKLDSSIDHGRLSQDYQGRHPQNATRQQGDKNFTDSSKRTCRTESNERSFGDKFSVAASESGSSQNVHVSPLQTSPLTCSMAKRKRVAMETTDLDLNFDALGTPQSSLVLKEVDSIKNEPGLDMDFGNYGDENSKDESVNSDLTGDQGSVTCAPKGSVHDPSSEDNLLYSMTGPVRTADETSTILGLRHMLQSIQSQFVDLERKLETATVAAEMGAGAEADPDVGTVHDDTGAPFHSNAGHKVVRKFQRPVQVFDTADRPESEELNLQAILGPYEPSDYFKKGSVASSILQSEVNAAVVKFSLDIGRRPKRIRMLAVQEVFKKLPDIPSNRETWAGVTKRINQKIKNSMYYNKIRTQAENEGLSVRQKRKAKSLIKSKKQNLGQPDKEVSDSLSQIPSRRNTQVRRKTFSDSPDPQASSSETELIVTEVRSLSS